jgi:hypothetical protein
MEQHKNDMDRIRLTVSVIIPKKINRNNIFIQYSQLVVLRHHQYQR